MNIILIGAPGSGKGTLANMINNHFGSVAISTGDIIRENIKNKTELGLVCQSYMDRGDFVPDELIIDMFKDKLDHEKQNYNSFILDGFPRTYVQAEKLNQILKIDFVIHLDVNEDVVMERILKRKVCENCKAIYAAKDFDKEVCDSCGGKLVVRSDDNKETLMNRLSVYEEQTKPLLKFYEEHKNLFDVDANLEADKVFENVCSILKGENCDL